MTSTLDFCTAVLILPQRQTALVAKQAAELDVLSGGRFRLGIGVGWNQLEYEALNENFHDRGKRSRSTSCARSGKRRRSASKDAGTGDHIDAIRRYKEAVG